MKAIIFSCLLILIATNNLRGTASWDWNTVYTNLISQHNTLRKKHRAGNLIKLTEIEEYAQATAKMNAQKGSLIHTREYYNGQPVGQNLYVSSWAPSADNILNGWYTSEIVHYDYTTGKSKDGGVVGHFTQVVWKSSAKIGCAYAVGAWGSYSNSYFVCCNYYPAGNYIGQETKNVFPPTS